MRLSGCSLSSFFSHSLILFLNLLEARLLVFFNWPNRFDCTSVGQGFLFLFSIFEYGLLLLPQVSFHLNFLIKFPNRRLLHSLICDKLGDLGGDEAVEGYAGHCQTALIPIRLRVTKGRLPAIHRHRSTHCRVVIHGHVWLAQRTSVTTLLRGRTGHLRWQIRRLCLGKGACADARQGAVESRTIVWVDLGLVQLQLHVRLGAQLVAGNL